MDELKSKLGQAPTAQAVPEDHEANGPDADDLQQVVATRHEQPQGEGIWAQEIVHEEELGRRSVALQELSPTIIALGRKLEQIRSAELRRYRKKLGALEPFQREAVEALTQGILNKILDGPVCELKAHAGAPEQQGLSHLVRRIFGVP